KHGQSIYGIVVERVNVAALRIDIKTAVKFQLRQAASENPLRLGKRSAGRSVVGPIKYLDPKQILILEKYFVRIGVHTNGAVRRIGVVNDPERRPVRIARRRSICVGGCRT